MKRTFSIITLGCFRNTYDSEVVAQRLLARGWRMRKEPCGCGIVLVNTCGFITASKEESLEVMRDVVALKKKGSVQKIYIFGCLVQRYQKELQKHFPEIDQWQGVEEFEQHVVERAVLTPAHINFLKLCEGCVNRCSYCAIPLIKGPLKSKTYAALMQEAARINERGVQELVLVGQDITAWGRDQKSTKTLVHAVEGILRAAPRIPWVRLLYMHPAHITRELLECIAHHPRVCKYLDIPFQHSNDRILRLMNRPITHADAMRLIEKIKKYLPSASLRTSCIVGFPTETEKEFNELLSFVRHVRFDRLGAFAYSREEGTPAYAYTPQVASATKARRLRRLMSVQSDISRVLSAAKIGSTQTVLVDGYSGGKPMGRTQHDAYEVDGEVFIEHGSAQPGDIVSVAITDADEYDLTGHIVTA